MRTNVQSPTGASHSARPVRSTILSFTTAPPDGTGVVEMFLVNWSTIRPALASALLRRCPANFILLILISSVRARGIYSAIGGGTGIQIRKILAVTSGNELVP